MKIRTRYNFILDGLTKKYIKNIWKALFFSTKDDLKELENWFVNECKKKNILLTNSGRSALYLLLKALKRKSINENVVMPGFSCIVVSNSIIAAGFQVKYVDIDTKTLSCSLADIHRQVDKNTAAIIVQHVFGFVDENIPTIRKLYPNIKIIEDCAHGLGGKFSDGSALGSKGDYAFYSFEQSKTITAWNGGLAALNCDTIFKRINIEAKKFKTESFIDDLLIFFRIWLNLKFLNYKNIFLGRIIFRILEKFFLFKPGMSKAEIRGNFETSKVRKMSFRKAKFLNIQLKSLNQNISHRRKLARLYEKYLNSSIKITKNSSILRYPFFVNDKDKTLLNAYKNGLDLGRWFSTPLHPALIANNKFYYVDGSCPKAESICKSIVNLPVSPKYNKQDVKNICKIFNDSLI